MSNPKTKAKYDETCLGVQVWACKGFKSSVNDCTDVDLVWLLLVVVAAVAVAVAVQAQTVHSRVRVSL
jgi:hypothetical protein